MCLLLRSLSLLLSYRRPSSSLPPGAENLSSKPLQRSCTATGEDFAKWPLAEAACCWWLQGERGRLVSASILCALWNGS